MALSSQMLRFALSATMVLTSSPSFAADNAGPAPGQEISDPKCAAVVKSCANRFAGEGMKTSAELDQVALIAKGSHAPAAGARDATSRGSAGYDEAKKTCESTDKPACKEKCKPEDQKKCESAVDKAMADGMGAKSVLDDANKGYGGTADATNGGGAGKGGEGAGAGGAMGAMLPAALGALAGYMMAKSQEEEEPEEDKQVYRFGAWQPDGTLNCSMFDAYKYQDCLQKLSERCEPKLADKSYFSDRLCMNFGSRYCGGGGGSSPYVRISGYPSDVYGAGGGSGGPMTSMVEPPALPPGSGVGQPLCDKVESHTYCRSATRKNCPSCLNLERQQDVVCAQNPSLCIAQNSPTQIDQARKTCPTDPMFKNPAYAGGGGPIASGLSGGGSLPTVVLPQSAKPGSVGSASPASAASAGSQQRLGVSGSTSAGSPGTGQYTTASASGSGVGSSGSGDPGAGLREGVTRGPGSVASYGGAGVGGAGRSGVVGSDRVASGGFQPASAGGNQVGPATDVNPQFAPSLFSTGSQIYRQRCQDGQFLNCP